MAGQLPLRGKAIITHRTLQLKWTEVPLVAALGGNGLEPLATSAGALKGVDDRVPGFEVLIVMDS